jgi:DNA-binding MarR family transcriptional regulator
MLKIAESTTSQLVERLVKAGLVHRETHLGDRRQMDLRLSTKGRRIMDQRTQSLMESYTKILSLLDDNDQQMFEDAFEKFHAIAVKLDQKLVHHGD